MPTAAATIQRPTALASARGAMVGSMRARGAQRARNADRQLRGGAGVVRPNIIPARRRQEDGRVGDMRPAQSRDNVMEMPQRTDAASRAQVGQLSGTSSPSSPQTRSSQIRPAVRRQGAEAREKDAGGAPEGALGGVEDMAAQKFRTWLDHLMKLGLVNIEAIPAWLAAVGLLNVRVLASLPPFKRTRFGKAFRFSADSIADAFNAKKGNFLALSPLTGTIAAGLVDATLALGIGISFVILILPMYLLSLGVKALFDEGTRALLTMFVKGLF